MTTTKKDIQDQVAKLQAEVDALNAKLADMPDDKPKKAFNWGPTERDCGWYIDLDCSGIAESQFLSSARNRHKYGLAFPTKEAAEKWLKRQEVTKKLRDLAEGYTFRRGESSYYIYYKHDYHKWGTWEGYNCSTPDTIYFPTREDAQKAIDTLGGELNVLLD